MKIQKKEDPQLRYRERSIKRERVLYVQERKVGSADQKHAPRIKNAALREEEAQIPGQDPKRSTKAPVWAGQKARGFWKGRADPGRVGTAYRQDEAGKEIQQQSQKPISGSTDPGFGRTPNRNGDASYAAGNPDVPGSGRRNAETGRFSKNGAGGISKRLLKRAGDTGKKAAASASGAQKARQEEAGREQMAQDEARKQAVLPAKQIIKAIGTVLIGALGAFSPVILVVLLVLFLALALFAVLLAVIGSLFGSASSGGTAAVNLSPEVEAYRDMVTETAEQYQMEEYIELILAVMMQESAGRTTDPMQASESGFNTRYPRRPGAITDPAYSIACGVQALKEALTAAEVMGSTDLTRIAIALQGYNFGTGYIRWMKRQGYTEWSYASACAFAELTGWGRREDADSPAGPWKYGDQHYPEHVLQYYSLGADVPSDGLPIPVYHQYDYVQAYGGGTIAQNGCGPTSFAMVASYLTGTSITPADVVAWCGDRYYVAGQGTSWGFFAAAASHYGIGSVRATYSAEEVKSALQSGCPVISSQGPGLFTRHGHFIVLRGITPDGRILVNDPNDNSRKQYAARQFDLSYEIHATSKCYWIFEARAVPTIAPVPTVAPPAAPQLAG